MDGLDDQAMRDKARVRLHVLDELLRAHDIGWPLIAAIDEARDKAEARTILMAAPFDFDAVAAEHILDRPLGSRTKEAIEFLTRERDDQAARLAE